MSVAKVRDNNGLYIFPDVIKGKKYKNLVNYLCNVADKIYFMFYEDMMYNDS